MARVPGAIMPWESAVVDSSTPVFGLSANQTSRRVRTVCRAVRLGDCFTGHSGTVGVAPELVECDV